MQGVQGDKGDTGDKGELGAAVTLFKASKARKVLKAHSRSCWSGRNRHLPQGQYIDGEVGPPAFSGAEEGDLYIDVNGDGWARDGSVWTNVGPIQGPQGPQG